MKEDRTFFVGDRVLNDPKSNSMYKGRIGVVTNVRVFGSGAMSVSVQYSERERETHPAYILEILPREHFDEGLFEI